MYKHTRALLGRRLQTVRDNFAGFLVKRIGHKFLNIHPSVDNKCSQGNIAPTATTQESHQLRCVERLSPSASQRQSISHLFQDSGVVSSAG